MLLLILRSIFPDHMIWRSSVHVSLGSKMLVFSSPVVTGCSANSDCRGKNDRHPWSLLARWHGQMTNAPVPWWSKRSLCCHGAFQTTRNSPEIFVLLLWQYCSLTIDSKLTVNHPLGYNHLTQQAGPKCSAFSKLPTSYADHHMPRTTYFPEMSPCYEVCPFVGDRWSNGQSMSRGLFRRVVYVWSTLNSFSRNSGRNLDFHVQCSAKSPTITIQKARWNIQQQGRERRLLACISLHCQQIWSFKSYGSRLQQSHTFCPTPPQAKLFGGKFDKIFIPAYFQHYKRQLSSKACQQTEAIELGGVI